MADAQQIRLNQLLLDREAQFVRVYDLEQAAAQILGEPYPFTKPPLPSDQRRKSKAAARGASAARDTLRRLEEDEARFRVTYRHFEREVTEEHDEIDALRSLFAAQGSRLALLRVETLAADGAVKTVLFTRSAIAKTESPPAG